MGTHLLFNFEYDKMKTEDVPMDSRIQRSLNKWLCWKENPGGPISRTEKLLLPEFLSWTYDMILLFQTKREQQKGILSLTLSHLESIS